VKAASSNPFCAAFTMNHSEPKNIPNMWAPFYAVLLSVLTYYSVLKEFANEMSDYCGHVYSYIPLLQGDKLAEGWMSIPYFLWHAFVIILHKIIEVPIEPASAIVSCGFACFSFFVLFYMIERYCAAKAVRVTPFAAATVAFALCVIQRIILPWADIGGAFSINPFHNPTQMCVKPLSLLCFAFTYDIFEKLNNSSYEGTFISMKKGLLRGYIALAVALFFSGMAKPTFAEMFIPTVGLLMLFEWGCRVVRKNTTAKAYFIELCKMFLVAVPTICYILLQFFAYFVWGGSYGMDESHMIITRWMEVWKLFSENIPLSIVLSLGFPLLIVMMDIRFFLKDNLGRIALVGFIVSLLEAGFLTEESKMTHGDFLWPMMSGMLLLWVAATLRFIVMNHSAPQFKCEWLNRTLVGLGWFVFYLFGFAGVVSVFGRIL